MPSVHVRVKIVLKNMLICVCNCMWKCVHMCVEGIQIVGYRESSTLAVLDTYIPTAAALGMYIYV